MAKLKTISYILELEFPEDNNFIEAKLQRLIDAFLDTFIEQNPSSLINLTIEKVDLEAC